MISFPLLQGTGFATSEYLLISSSSHRLIVLLIIRPGNRQPKPPSHSVIVLIHRVRAISFSTATWKGARRKHKVIESVQGRGGEYYAFCTGVEYFLCAIVFTAIIIARCTTLNGWLASRCNNSRRLTPQYCNCNGGPPILYVH